MKICMEHWNKLRSEIEKQGLKEWVAPNGEVALEQLVDGLKRQEDTIVNYDPLMSCHWMLVNRAMHMYGFASMTEEFGCVVCRTKMLRGPEGQCLCGNPDCQNKTGGVQDPEEWLSGPKSCVTAVKEYMFKQGWIKGD